MATTNDQSVGGGRLLSQVDELSVVNSWPTQKAETDRHPRFQEADETVCGEDETGDDVAETEPVEGQESSDGQNISHFEWPTKFRFLYHRPPTSRPSSQHGDEIIDVTQTQPPSRIQSFINIKPLFHRRPTEPCEPRLPVGDDPTSSDAPPVPATTGMRRRRSLPPTMDHIRRRSNFRRRQAVAKQRWLTATNTLRNTVRWTKTARPSTPQPPKADISAIMNIAPLATLFGSHYLLDEGGQRRVPVVIEFLDVPPPPQSPL
jgi:hypothetical protein